MDNLAKKIDVLFELGKYEDVLTLAYENLYSIDANKELLYNYIIVSHRNLQEFRKALEVANEALGIYPSSSVFLYLRSKSYFNISAYKNALQDIKEALELEPNNARYLAHYAKILLSQNEFIKAKEKIEEALEIDATETEYHLTLAMILYMLNGEVTTREIVDDVLAKEPHNIAALDMKQQYFTSKLKEKKSILKNLLFLDPFDKESQKDIKFIKYYYKFLPSLMAVALFFAYLLQSNRREFGFLEYVLPASFFILGTIGSKDWRLNVPFIATFVSFDAYYNLGKRGIDFGEFFYIIFMAIIFQFVFMGAFALFNILKFKFTARLEQQKNNKKNPIVYFLFLYPFDNYEVLDTKAMQKYYKVVPALIFSSLILNYIYIYHFQDIYFKVGLIILFFYTATEGAKNLWIAMLYIFLVLLVMREFSCDGCLMSIFTSIIIGVFFQTIYKLTRRS